MPVSRTGCRSLTRIANPPTPWTGFAAGPDRHLSWQTLGCCPYTSSPTTKEGERALDCISRFTTARPRLSSFRTGSGTALCLTGRTSGITSPATWSLSAETARMRRTVPTARISAGRDSFRRLVAATSTSSGTARCPGGKPPHCVRKAGAVWPVCTARTSGSQSWS